MLIILLDFIKKIADDLVGIPYKHNGRNKNGLDCWGLVYLFFKELGIELPKNDGEYVHQKWYKMDPDRYERGLESLGKEVGHYRHLQLLDIPYFRLYRNVITHSGVMIGDNQFIHVLINKEVSITNLKRRIWRAKYAGAKRVDISQFPGDIKVKL